MKLFLNYVYIKTFIACPRIKITSLIILHVDFGIGDGNYIFHFLEKKPLDKPSATSQLMLKQLQTYKEMDGFQI